LIVGLLAWHDYDRILKWLPITEKLVTGLHRVAGQNKQRAWFQNSSSPDLGLAGFAESYEKSNRSAMRYQLFLEAAPQKGGGSWSVDRITLEYPGVKRVALDDDFNTDDIKKSDWVTIINDDAASIQQKDGSLRFENRAVDRYRWNTQIVHSRESFPAVAQGHGLPHGSLLGHSQSGASSDAFACGVRESPRPPWPDHPARCGCTASSCDPPPHFPLPKSLV